MSGSGAGGCATQAARAQRADSCTALPPCARHTAHAAAHALSAGGGRVASEKILLAIVSCGLCAAAAASLPPAHGPPLRARAPRVQMRRDWARSSAFVPLQR